VPSVSPCVQACHWFGMASKDLCAVCEKPFYGKQKFIRCGECDSRFHCNCLQTGVLETIVSAFTGKSAYKCENCRKLASNTTNEHSVDNRNRKEALSTET
jgi:DNA-directed RNA polymerase subunit RPC12/RpoP